MYCDLFIYCILSSFPVLTVLYLDRLPCRSVCDAFESNCASLIGRIPALQPNCSSVGGIGPGKTSDCAGTVLTAGAPDFPLNNTRFSATLSTYCNAYLESDGVTASPVSVAYTCPAPLVIPDNPEAPLIDGINCAAPCPTLIFSDTDYDEVTAFVCQHSASRSELMTELCCVLWQMRAISGLSFIACTFVFLTWLVHPKKRAGKGRYVFAFNISIFMLSLVVLISTGSSPDRTARFGCKNNSQDVDQGDGGYCIF